MYSVPHQCCLKEGKPSVHNRYPSIYPSSNKSSSLLLSTATPRHPCIRWGVGEAADRQKQASEAQRSISPTDNVNTIGRVRELAYWREDETAEQELEGVPSTVVCLPFPSLAGTCRVYLTLTCEAA